MSIPTKLFAPCFRHQKLGLFLTIMVGIMVYVATFAMSAEATLSAITFTWDRGMQSRLTVEIPATDDENSVPQADRVQQIINVLHTMPQVATVLPLSDEDTIRLLKPWINQPELLKVLPVPTLIDIERKPDTLLEAEDVRQQLKSIVSDVRVDDHTSWLSDLNNLVNGLTLIAALVILLTGITLIIAVSLICHAIIATEQETMSLLHVLGATDDDIAHHFQIHTRRLSWPAALVGFFLAMASTAVLLFFLRHFADPSMLEWSHWMVLGIMTFLIPIAAVIIASSAAKSSVLKLLYTMP